MRVSLPIPPRGRLSTVIDATGDSLPRNIMLSAGGVRLRHADANAVAEATSAGLYVPLLGLDEDVPELASVAARVIHRAAEASPINATRVAVLAWREAIETPYYPLSTPSGASELGLSYLYVEAMREYLTGRTDLARLARKLSEPVSILARMGFRVTADYSLSPWMRESVALLIRDCFGVEPPSLGINYAIMRLNSIIESVAGLPHACPSGFNEVMLPYAEDSRLKELGGLGPLSVKDLLTYSASCVAGPDMAVVPWGASEAH